MKIKLTRSMAGGQVLPAGTVVDTTETEAKNLVAAGFAVYFTEEPEVQTTESSAFQEREMAITARRRKRHK